MVIPEGNPFSKNTSAELINARVEAFETNALPTAQNVLELDLFLRTLKTAAGNAELFGDDVQLATTVASAVNKLQQLKDRWDQSTN